MLPCRPAGSWVCRDPSDCPVFLQSFAVLAGFDNRFMMKKWFLHTHVYFCPR